MTHRLRFAARSDRGLLRSNNQDSVYAGERLLIVADGMGGHAAGDLASRVVVAAFTPLDAEPPQADLLTVLRRAVVEGNNSIAELVEADPELDGMGTTATAMLFDGDRVALAHVGDSRAYLYRNGVLHQLSHDDTFVQSLVDDGRITEEEAAHHPQRNLLLRALNGTEPEPMLSIREISTGDRFMICSDGLSSVVGADAIADALADPDPDLTADRLIELALVAGGPDNVTVIVADVIDVGARASSPTPAGPVDPEATGPLRPIHETQRMPRVPLPGPDERPAGTTGAPTGADGAYDGFDDSFDDEDDDEDGYEYGDRFDDAGDDPDAVDEDTDPTRRAGEPSDRERRRIIRRRWWIVAAVIVLLAGLSTGAVLWTRAHYFVGVADGKVVVFKGVQGSAFGVSLASVEEDSCAGQGAGCSPITIDDLQPSDRLLVLDGIPVSDLQQARDVMATLAGQLLPYCDTLPAGTTGGSTTAPGSATGSASPTTTSAAGTVTAPPTTAGQKTPTTTPAKTTPPKTTARATTTRAPARTTAKAPARTTAKATAKSPTSRVTSRPGDRLHGLAGIGTADAAPTGTAGSDDPAVNSGAVSSGAVSGGAVSSGAVSSAAVPDGAISDSLFGSGPTNCRVRR
ncbi:PP2C family protein-serine/threonine phosphatase [Nakamurella lactea]|uniref:PP2C family protein-serine/threonine phosphatase n=1 Tax=Nakamurella lactea TaxID=459515 RepID=UPI000422B083|nr:protein phosphatase 2C domain-containing protein [Nakamurella lactea]